MVKYKMYELYLNILIIFYKFISFICSLIIRKNNFDDFYRYFYWTNKEIDIVKIKKTFIEDLLLNLSYKKK